MLFKKCKQPARLYPKKENKLEDRFKLIKCILKSPETIIIIIFIILFCLAINFAIHESMSFFVYNRGL